MDQYAALIVLPNVLATAISALISYKVLTGKATEHRLAMAICFAFIAINSMVLLGQKVIPDIGTILVLVFLEYLTGSIILIALIIFVMQYVGLGRKVTPRFVSLVSAPALLTLLFNATNHWHGLFYSSFSVAEMHGFYLFQAEYGPLFLLWMAFFMLSVISTAILVAKVVWETPMDRGKAPWALMAAMAVILITGVLYVLSDRSDPLVDILSIGLTLTALTIYLGDRRSDFMDLEVIRFRETVDGMEDSVIILNSSLKSIFSNRQGQRILEQNLDFIKERMLARGLKVPMGVNKWETALVLDGSPRHYIVTTSDIFRGDNPIGAVLTFHDITNRKVMEDDIRRANRKLNTLNQVIRHDIRNDLTALWGYIELLEMTPLNERQQEMLRKMSERARSVDRHLAFSSDQQSAGYSSMMWHDMHPLIERTLSQVDTGPIKVETDLQGLKVYADPMLPSVFHCLADNTARHGKGATMIGISAKQTETGLSLIWEDDGVGVSPEHKDKIFEKGFGQNTGEGLFLAKDILTSSGASISEEGQYGSGVRFVIRVPSGWYAWSSSSS